MKRTIYVFAMLVATNFALTSCSSDDDAGNVNEPIELREVTFSYQFNNGQIVADAPYSGSHTDNLMAEMKIEELMNEETRITVTLKNSIDGEVYPVHAHDAADPSTTPNGTPYNETPNSDVFTAMMEGTGGDASASRTTSMSFDMITEQYEAFFVVHDPLQTLSTTDLTTYVILGTFARTQPTTSFARASYSYEFNMGQLNPDFAYSGPHASDLTSRLTLQELANGNTRVSVMLDNSIMGETYMVHAHDFADPAETPNGTPYDETPNSSVLTLMIQGGSYANRSMNSSMSFEFLEGEYGGFYVIHDPLQDLSTTDPTTYVGLGIFAN